MPRILTPLATRMTIESMRAALQGFGPYRLLSVIAEGEVCSVYRAVKDAEGPTSYPIALAIVHPAGAADADAAKAFLLRSEAATGFIHPSVAAVIDSGTLEGRSYAIRELVDGLSLDRFLPKRGKGLKPAEAKHVLLTVLGALTAARVHDGTLAHGRLDTGAIMVDTDGTVRVTGFGQPDANPAADLLAVARLAQTMCRGWPPEMDAWIDRVQDNDDGFETPAQALEALTNIPLENEAKARAGLVRRLKRQLKAMAATVPEPNAGEVVVTPKTTVPDDASTADASPDATADRAAKAARAKSRRSGDPASTRRGDRRRKTDRRGGSDRRDAPRHPELDAGIQQARWVAALCGVAVLAALVIEITRHIG